MIVPIWEFLLFRLVVMLFLNGDFHGDVTVIWKVEGKSYFSRDS